MALYDLHCTGCGRDFIDVQASVAEKTEKRILCPECGSNQMEKIYSPVNIHVKTGSASADCPNSRMCGAGCPHMRQ